MASKKPIVSDELIEMSSNQDSSSSPPRTSNAPPGNTALSPSAAANFSRPDPRVKTSDEGPSTVYLDESNASTATHLDNLPSIPIRNPSAVELASERVNPSELEESSNLLGSYQEDPKTVKKPTIETAAVELSNDGASTSDNEKHGSSPELCIEKAKTALNREVGPIWIFLWTLQHLVPLAATAALFFLNGKEVYWFDLDETINYGDASSFQRWLQRYLTFPYNDFLKALLYLGKLHEYLLGASLGAIVLHVASIKLLGPDGIPFGFLTAAYRGPEFFTTKAFRSSLLSSKIFAAFLVFCAILSALMGPSSNSLLQPSLDWWTMNNPFNGTKLPSYVMISANHSMWPDYVSYNYFPADCDAYQYDPYAPYCPSAGFSTIKFWASAFALTGANGNISIPEPMGGTARALVSQEAVPFAKMNSSNSGSFTTTADDSLTRLVGNFYSYIKENDVGTVEETIRSRYTLDPGVPTYQPLVAVSCNLYNYSTARQWTSGEMVFPYPKNAASNMTFAHMNTSGYLVPRNTWDFDRPMDTVNFTFVDIWNYYNHTSLAAVFTIPYQMWRYDSAGKVANVTQQSFVVPCSIEARWLTSTLWFDHQVNTAVSVSQTDPLTVLNVTEGQDDSKVREQYGISDIVRISSKWANTLNLWTITGKVSSQINGTTNSTSTSTTTSKSTFTNYTMMESLVRSFLINYSVNITNTTTNQNYTATGLTIAVPAHAVVTNDDYFTNVTALVAKVLGFQMTDGLARINSGRAQIVAFGADSTDPNATIHTQGLDRQLRDSPYNLNFDQTAWAAASTWYFKAIFRVDRWGYGWSFRSRVTILAAVVLGIHSIVVLIYLAYTIGVRRNWMKSAWDDIGDLIALALQSRPAPELQGTCAGVDAPSTFKQRVRVREVPAGGDHLELVVGEKGKKMNDGIPRMRTRYG